MIIVVLVWSALMIVGLHRLATIPPMIAVPATPPQWVLDAYRLIEDLSIVVKQVSETGVYINFADRMTLQEKADRILLRLWLTTGMPPLVEEQGRLPLKLLKQNVFAYTQYVADNSNLTCEEIHRKGLQNAIDAIGSPLWYMTVKYLAATANVMPNWPIEIHTTPKRLLIAKSLSKEAYERLSHAFSDWLDANKKRMIWNAKGNRFCPQNGGYVGTEELRWTILLESSTPEEVAYLKSRAKEVAEWRREQ